MVDLTQPLPGAPRFADYLNAAGGDPVFASALMGRDAQMRPAPPLSPGANYPNTGTGNFFTSGLGAGLHEALGALGSAGEGAGRLVGANNFADAASQYAEGQRQAAAASARPDLEDSPWYSPTGTAYRVTKALPQLAAVLAGAGIGAAAAPEVGVAGLLGGAAASYPFAVGGNVQRAEGDFQRQVTPGEAAKAALIGVPEAALNALPAESLLTKYGLGVGGSLGERLVKGAVGQAVIQAPVAAAQDALTQLMGDPNRTIGQRAQEVIQAALGGAVQGAVFGGALGAARPAGEAPTTPDIGATPPEQVSNDALMAATAAPLALPAPGSPGLEPRLEPPQRFAPTPEPLAGETAGDVVAPPAQPGQVTPLLTDQRTYTEGVRPISGEPVITPPPEAAPPSGPPALEFQPQVASADAIPMPGPVGQPPVIEAPGPTPPRPFMDLSNEALLAQARALDANQRDPARLSGMIDEMRFRSNMADLANRPAALPPPSDDSLFQANAPSTAPEAEEAPAEFKAPWELPRQKEAVQAQTLRAWVRANGGLQDPQGEVKAILDKPQIGMLNKKGMDLDRAREAAVEAGYLGADRDAAMSGTTVSDFLDALRRDKVYSTLDADEVDRAQQAVQANSFASRLKSSADEIQQYATEGGNGPVPKELLVRAAELLHNGDESHPDNALERAAIQLESERGDDRSGDLQAANRAQVGQDVAAPTGSAKAPDQLPLRQADAGTTTEAGPEGSRQSLIPGVEPVTARQQAETLAAKPLKGGNAPLDTGLFGGPLEPELFAKATANARTPLDAEVNAQVLRGASAQDIFSHIAKNHPDSDMRDVADALRKTGVNPSVKWLDSPGSGLPSGIRPEEVNGLYNRSQDRIGLLSGDNSATTILHEGVHAATAKALDSNTSAAVAIKKLFATVKSRSPNDDAYGLSNPHEFVAEAMTNPTFRDFLKNEASASGNAGKDLWQSFKNTVFKMLRMPERGRNAFDQVMEHMPDLMDQNRGVVGAASEAELPSRAQRSDDAVGEGIAAAQRIRDGLAQRGGLGGLASGVWSKVRGGFMQWFTPDQLSYLGRDIPAVAQKQGVDQLRGTRQSAQYKIANQTGDLLSGLNKAQAKSFNIFARATHLGINGMSPWESHSWLDPKWATEDKATWMRAQSAAAELMKTPEGRQALEGSIAGNRAQWRMTHIASLAMAVDRNPEFKETLGSHPAFANNFFDALQTNAKAHDDPTLANGLAGADLSAKLAAVKDMIAPMKDAADALKPGRPAFQKDRQAFEAAKAKFDTLGDMVSTIERSEGELDRVPNFPAWRKGEYAVAGKFAVKDGEKISDGQVKTLQDAMTKMGLGDTVLDSANGNPSIYVKLDNAAQAERLGNLFKDMQNRGVLDKGTPVLSGKAEDAVGRFLGISQAQGHKLVGLMRGALPEPPKSLSPEEAEQWSSAWRTAQSDMVNQFMSMLPDSSLTKLSARRKLVQGYMPDVIEATKARMGNMARGVANLSTAGDTADAISAMRNQLDDFKHSDSPIDRKDLAHQVVKEVAMREAARQLSRPTPIIDAIRAVTHVGEIGLSVPYFMLVQSQLGTLSLPELGKNFGYAKSAQALMSAMPETMEIMKLALQGKGRRTFQLRDNVLGGNNKLSQGTKDFILNLDNRGAFNESSFTHQMVEGELPHWLEHGVELGSMMSLYSEQLPRIATALAARNLAMSSPKSLPAGMSVEDYAHEATRQSQFAWGQGDTARGFGTAGAFGPGGKLMSQFMGFSVKLGEKIYREVADAAGKPRPGETPALTQARASEARRWLGGHAAATVALAGSMGLPGPSFAGEIFDKLADWATGEDSWDVNSMYRHFLNNTFGPQMGEVIARGAPRALGIDMSKSGEADLPDRLLPFMQLMTEKRKFEDREKDLLQHMSGSAVGLAYRSVLGLRDMLNGDYLKGGIKVLPELFKGPLEAYQVAERGGYPNSKGVVDPNLHPGPLQIGEAALGIDTAGQAESEEVQKAASGLNAMKQYREQNILQHLALAARQNDPASLQYWQGQNQAFMQEHPGVRPPMMGLGEYMRRQMQGEAIARQNGLPMGVNPRDMAARRALDYGNFVGR